MQKKTLKLAIIGAVIFVLTVMCTAVAVRHMVLTEVRSAETADLTKPEEVLAVVEEENEPVIDKSFQEDPEWQAENERLLNEQAQENGDDWIRIQLHRQGNIFNATIYTNKGNWTTTFQ